MTFLDDLRDALEKLKRKFGISWQKLLEQIPDSDRLDSYRFDEILKKYVLKSTMPENEPYILDENRNLKVVNPNFYEYNHRYIAYDDFYTRFDLDFLVDSISISVYDLTTDTAIVKIWYYDIINEVAIGDEIITTPEQSSDYHIQIDVRAHPYFRIHVYSGNTTQPCRIKIIFSKQKKTKISDIAYNESTWNAVIDIAPSKNAVRDKLEAIISNVAYNESTWNGVVAIAPSKNAIRDKLEAMDTLTEAEILALTWIEEDITDLDHDDISAIHDDQGSEISAITEKETLHNNDMFLIEDSEASNVKKMVKKLNLPGGYTQAQVDALFNIGSGNKAWINCILEGSNDNTWHKSNVAYYNAGADDVILIFGIPLPYIIGGSHNLVITRIKIGVDDADTDDYVDQVILYGWSDYTTVETLLTLDWDALYGKDVEENINDHADQTIGGAYDRVIVAVDINGSGALECDVSLVQIEYYYTS